jgi:hypothetical protein
MATAIKKKTIKASAKKTHAAFGIPAQVEFAAAAADGKGPVPFSATFYTGGKVDITGWDLPVVIDLAGLKESKVLVANLDHDRTKRVGNFALTNDRKSLVANGTAHPDAFPAAREVVAAAGTGYKWQASFEVDPSKVETVKAGRSVQVNGREQTGPMYVTRVGTLKGFGFVSHGADDDTTATIAASAAQSKGTEMKAELKAWIAEMGADPDELSDEQVASWTAQFEGKSSGGKKKPGKLGERMDAQKAEVARQDEITEIAMKACDSRPYDIDAIKQLAEQAIDGKWGIDKFRLELFEAAAPPAHTVFRSRRDDRLNDRILEAAVCQAGRIDASSSEDGGKRSAVRLEDHYTDQELQLAHDRFKGRIGLKQLFLLSAEANGYHNNHSQEVNKEVQNAAFGLVAPQQRAAGFSTVSLSNITSNVGNKFLMVGWNFVDLTPLEIAAITNVNDFKEITTVSLLGDLQFEKVGKNGELKHGMLSDLTYGNKADTYGKILTISRQDIINDDLGALTSVPRRLGRGSALKLNDIFWAEFLNNSAFFHANNNNVNTGVADMTDGGLEATETIFMNQTDPDGKPLGALPAMLIVPTPLKSKANVLMTSDRMIDGTATAARGDGNPWKGRFKVKSSPYMSNSLYTGYSAQAWYMAADPLDLAIIEIVALFGKVMPNIDTAEAIFNVLGFDMRGYSDIGVRKQEKRGAVRADGGTS